MSEKDISIYEGKVFDGEKYKDQGVINGDASVLEILENITGRRFIKIETQDLEDFLNGKLPFRDLNSLGLDKRDKECLFGMIRRDLEVFIGQNGYRNIESFVYIKQYEIDNVRKLNYFRWDLFHIKNLIRHGKLPSILVRMILKRIILLVKSEIGYITFSLR